jgi:hypothetical protein
MAKLPANEIASTNSYARNRFLVENQKITNIIIPSLNINYFCPNS